MCKELFQVIKKSVNMYFEKAKDVEVNHRKRNLRGQSKIQNVLYP